MTVQTPFNRYLLNLVSTLAMFKGGHQVVVDSVYGEDVTGGYARPFKTLLAAKAFATSGDTIVVLAGTYVEHGLQKTGVNWHFMSGAVVDSGAADYAFDDGGVLCSYDVTGDGTFNGSFCVRVAGANSVVNFAAKAIVVVELALKVEVTATVRLIVPHVECTSDAANDTNLWISDGSPSVWIDCDRWLTLRQSFKVAGVAPKLYFRARQILNASTTVTVYHEWAPSNAAAVLVLDFDTMQQCYVTVFGGSAYVTGRSISAPLGDPGVLGAVLIQQYGAGDLYLNVGEISTGAGNAKAVLNCGGGGSVHVYGSRIRNGGSHADGVAIQMFDNLSRLVLHGGVALVASSDGGAECIRPDAAADVFVYGVVVGNRAKHANATVRVGTLTISALVA